MKFIFTYLKKYRRLVALVLSVKFMATVLELLIPYVLEFMIDTVVPSKSIRKVIFLGLVMVLLAVSVRFVNVFANRKAIRVAEKCTYEIRRDLFWKSINFTGSELDDIGLPSLTSRMTSDSYNVQNFIRAIQTMGVRAPILLFGGMVLTVIMDAGLSVILLVMAPVMILLVIFISSKGIPMYEKVQDALDQIVRIMRENITGIRVVKALSREEHERERYEKANDDFMKKDIRASVLMALPGPLITLFLNTGLTFVVIYGARRVNDGITKPGVILAFLTYFNMIMMGVMGLNRIFMMMSKADASAKRIAEVICEEDDLPRIPEETLRKAPGEDYIIFDHVSFRYGKDSTYETNVADFGGEERKNCLSNIDFRIRKGSSLGIIGPTGCGKTTIVNLLMRFYDVTEGAVYVDGRDVRTYEKDELRKYFGTVFQNDVIFAESLRENITFGRNVTEEELKESVSASGAAEFIENYEDTYDHMAVIRGANLSGGQKQRVLIARALSGHPRILVLDDSSSALDYRTDAALRKAIRERYGDTTMIVIAQRISSIMNLDRILVLEEGEAAGYGTHEELMETCPMYREIYHTQMGEMH